MIVAVTAFSAMTSVAYAEGVAVNADTSAKVGATDTRGKVNKHATTNSQEIVKSKKGVAEQNANIEVNRKEKAEAKAKGDLLDQASQSVQIGVNKTARGMADINHDVHVEMKEEGMSNTPRD